MHHCQMLYTKVQNRRIEHETILRFRINCVILCDVYRQYHWWPIDQWTRLLLSHHMLTNQSNCLPAAWPPYNPPPLYTQSNSHLTLARNAYKVMIWDGIGHKPKLAIYFHSNHITPYQYYPSDLNDWYITNFYNTLCFSSNIVVRYTF